MSQPKPLAKVVSTGSWLPDRVLTNAELERMVDTSDQWIRERTGIRERRIAEPHVTAADMGAAAARVALERAGTDPGEVDVLILATATPDRLLPSTACDVQALLGASNAAAFDVNAACSGFLYALTVAEGYLAAGRGTTALVVCTEKMSAITDWSDRSTCVLFGDGAGAAVVRRSDDDAGIVSSYLRSDGTLAELLWRPAGGARMPLTHELLEAQAHMVKMAGREVFKAAVRSMADAADQALAAAGLTGADIDLLIPHQANYRIIESTARYAGIPMEKVFINVDRYGNMSSATLPIALDEAASEGRLKPGDRLLLVAFGAGFTWASMVMNW
ncbi:MAG TPA: beta-ketoacyl-ACP synthase III [Longimicrobiales bacterium]|nr:beta-ketoacyl-ACP synthase III [Longimicrobiales bacterium]